MAEEFNIDAGPQEIKIKQDVPTPHKKKKYVIFLLAFFFLIVVSLLLVALYKVQTITKEAQALDAKVDWQAVATGKNPIYITQYRVVKIESSDVPAVEKTIEELQLQVDVWNDEGERRDFLFGGATDTAIQKLRGKGYQVTVLYHSYEEYQKAMEQQ
jgi:hypothetical protein